MVRSTDFIFNAPRRVSSPLPLIYTTVQLGAGLVKSAWQIKSVLRYRPELALSLVAQAFRRRDLFGIFRADVVMKEIVQEVADHIDNRFDIFLACQVKGSRYGVRPGWSCSISTVDKRGKTAQGDVEQPLFSED